MLPLSHTSRRCQDELKAFHGSAKEDEEILSGKAEATERQRLCAGVRGGERMALQVWWAPSKQRRPLTDRRPTGLYSLSSRFCEPPQQSRRRIMLLLQSHNCLCSVNATAQFWTLTLHARYERSRSLVWSVYGDGRRFSIPRSEPCHSGRVSVMVCMRCELCRENAS